jgi:hypothetical protein
MASIATDGSSVFRMQYDIDNFAPRAIAASDVNVSRNIVGHKVLHPSQSDLTL